MLGSFGLVDISNVRFILSILWIMRAYFSRPFQLLMGQIINMAPSQYDKGTIWVRLVSRRKIWFLKWCIFINVCKWYINHKLRRSTLICKSHKRDSHELWNESWDWQYVLFITLSKMMNRRVVTLNQNCWVLIRILCIYHGNDLLTCNHFIV